MSSFVIARRLFFFFCSINYYYIKYKASLRYLCWLGDVVMYFEYFLYSDIAMSWELCKFFPQKGHTVKWFPILIPEHFVGFINAIHPHYRSLFFVFCFVCLFFFHSARGWIKILQNKLEIVGNKAKGRIWKRVFQENKARQIFRKTNISYPLMRTRTFVHQGVRNVCFSENLAWFIFLRHPF